MPVRHCGGCGRFLPYPEGKLLHKCGFTSNKNHTTVDVRKQKHYNDFKIQPATFIGENKIDFLAGNVIKYVVRYDKKNGVEDLHKAKHYLDMLIERTQKGTVTP